MTVTFILVLLAFICFIASAFNVIVSRVALIPLGLALLTLAWLIVNLP